MHLWPLKTIYYTEMTISTATHIFILKNKWFRYIVHIWGHYYDGPLAHNSCHLNCLKDRHYFVSVVLSLFPFVPFLLSIMMSHFIHSASYNWCVAIPNRYYNQFIHSASYHNLWCKSTMGFACWVDKLAFNAAIPNKLANCKWKVQSEEAFDHCSLLAPPSVFYTDIFP
ncbi:hypothetical protein EDC04DRAFT_2610920 [Pisolithus marmoratus]|nr:hypothetical protein EDC04DRAFT_2610920 [Pisolithus marmoratus]